MDLVSDHMANARPGTHREVSLMHHQDPEHGTGQPCRCGHHKEWHRIAAATGTPICLGDGPDGFFCSCGVFNAI